MTVAEQMITQIRDALLLKSTDTVPTHGTILCVIGPKLAREWADQLSALLRQIQEPSALATHWRTIAAQYAEGCGDEHAGYARALRDCADHLTGQIQEPPQPTEVAIPVLSADERRQIVDMHGPGVEAQLDAIASWQAGYFSALAKVLARVSGSDLCPTTAEAVWDQISIYTSSLLEPQTDWQSKIARAFEVADWTQVYLNGGPPCFHLQEDEGTFCLRAQRWQGHGIMHDFQPMPSPASQTGWQSIATAPTDGTWVLLAGGAIRYEWGGGDQPRCVVGQWTHHLKGREEADGRWQFAWYDGGYYGTYEHPTHWMSLPEPPTTTQEPSSASALSG